MLKFWCEWWCRGAFQASGVCVLDTDRGLRHAWGMHACLLACLARCHGCMCLHGLQVGVHGSVHIATRPCAHGRMCGTQ